MPRCTTRRLQTTKGAVARTVPFILTIYALVVLWYLSNGFVRDDVERARRRAPWYREKTEPSFGDMLAALQAKTGGSEPILLHVESKVGHGKGKPVSKKIEEATDIISFAMERAGLLKPAPWPSEN